MTLITKILTILKIKGLRQVDLANYLGVSQNVISTWKARGTDPPAEYLLKISGFLGMSLENLLSQESDKEPEHIRLIKRWTLDDNESNTTKEAPDLVRLGHVLSEQPQGTHGDNINAVIALYQTANEQARQSAIAALKYGQSKSMYIAETSQKGSSSFIQIKEPNNRGDVLVPIVGRAAAGLPIEMIENDYGEYKTTDRAIRAGDFGIVADGDSMIDAGINDGDVAIIHPQDKVSNGEIALVAVNDGSTIKKVYVYSDRIELVPMNDDHEKQIYGHDEDIRVLGKLVSIVAST